MRSMKKGFTLIELMIVIAIIAIIAAIAIPNLMRSRILANEANAVAALKAYTTAQVTFQTGHQGRAVINTKTGANGYADNFSNLFYGQPVTDKKTAGSSSTTTDYNIDDSRNLALINQVFADSRAEAVFGGSATTNYGGPMKGASGAQDYQGYLFAEDKALLKEIPASTENNNTASYSTSFAVDFALVGVPVHSSTSGNNAFWVGQEGTVWRAGLEANKTATESLASVAGTATSTPWSGTDGSKWDTN